MSLTEILSETLKAENSRRSDNRADLIQKAEAFELLVKRGIITPESYWIAPISTLPLKSSALRFS